MLDYPPKFVLLRSLKKSTRLFSPRSELSFHASSCTARQKAGILEELPEASESPLVHRVNLDTLNKNAYLMNVM